MALIKCPDCGNDMSENAKCCNKCGCINKNYQLKVWSTVGLVLSILGVLFSLPIAYRMFCAWFYRNLFTYAELIVYVVFCIVPSFIFSATGFGVCFVNRRNNIASKGIVLSVVAFVILAVSALIIVSWM